MVSGKGSYLYGQDGRAYLDFATGIAVASTGHCHPHVVDAIKTQAETLIHACAGVVYYDANVALAEKITEKLGHGLDSVFFTQSGSEAVEASLKLARYLTRKPRFLAFTGGFHGRTFGALAVTTSKDKYRQGYEPYLGEVSFFPYPYLYRSAWGDENAETKAIAALETFFETHGADAAAVIIEPILGEGGYVSAPPAFLKRLRELCTEQGVLLIFDEVQSGFGRTGQWFAFQQTGVVPDIIALAKGIASGMPLGACVSRAELMSKWTTSAHGGTYGGNPVTCAAGLATLEVLEKTTLDQINQRSREAQDFIQAELADHPFLGDVRITGLMIGLEFVKDKTTKAPHPEFVKKCIETGIQKGLILISCGLHDNVIRLVPPLTITPDELNQGLRLFKEVLHAVH